MRDTIEMAREAGFESNGPMVVVRHSATGSWVGVTKEIERLVEIVRADEREVCAKVCEEESRGLGGVAEGAFVTDFGKHTHMSMAAGAQNCATAIRARGETE